jgi:hypothetical protein
MHNGYSYALFLDTQILSMHECACINRTSNYMRMLKYKRFYRTKLRAQFTLLNYARMVGVILTENYVKKIRFSRQNYGVEFCSIIMG